jgi:hypothetical protein
MGVLIHFNMATYIDVDGCSGQMVPNISLFDPHALNTDNWAQTMTDLGANYAVLVAKVSDTRTARATCSSALLSARVRLSHGADRRAVRGRAVGRVHRLQLFDRVFAGQRQRRARAVRRQLPKATHPDGLLLHSREQHVAQRRSRSRKFE